jgi:predicted DCC family thiol-disulfide oxidoreductase YuxK
LEKPLLIFDGDCGFCRVWITRWKYFTHDRVDYAPSQEVGNNFPEISPEEFQKAVQLVEPDGHRSSGAEAVFRALQYGGSSSMYWAYQNMPGFAFLAEYFYGIVAGHRPGFSILTRWLWGAPSEPISYRQVRWVFLRALAVIYAFAFGSFGVQIRGLIGADGILPAHSLLSHLSAYGAVRFWYVPTLAWINSSDTFLVSLCTAGFLFAVLLFLNITPRLSLVALWTLYLSIVSIGGDFMNFQWDALLLETGFLAIFLAPRGFLPQRQGVGGPAPWVVFLFRWLLFRLMFQSALVKWLSGDPLWHHLIALTVHYQTQPIPNPIAWYAHQMPVGFHQLSCFILFVIEGIVPFLIVGPTRLRRFAFWPLVGLQGLILASGNYAYFNWLTIALCLFVLEDSSMRSFLPSWSEEPIAFQTARFPTWAGAILFFLTCIPFAQVLGLRLPNAISAPALWVSPLRSFNSYGLFAVMTPKRPEIILERSNDRKTWRAYEFKYKPGDVSRRPPQVAPLQPRLDWQMWFAALGDYRQNQWFLNLCVRLLQGSKPVIALLRLNPFPDKPPVYLRATVYDYRFTTPREHNETGHWWSREVINLYCPMLSLKEN